MERVKKKDEEEIVTGRKDGTTNRKRSTKIKDKIKEERKEGQVVKKHSKVIVVKFKINE